MNNQSFNSTIRNIEDYDLARTKRLIVNNQSLVAEMNDDLRGYVITFEDRSTAQTQFNLELNRLDTNFGHMFLERFTEYDDDLSDDQHEAVEMFVKMINQDINQAIWG